MASRGQLESSQISITVQIRLKVELIIYLLWFNVWVFKYLRTFYLSIQKKNKENMVTNTI